MAKNPFDDALDDLRISGSVLLHEAYSAEWAIDVPDERELRSLLGLSGGQRVLPFHLVRQGRLDLTLQQGDALQLGALDLSILFGGSAHRLSFGQTTRVVPLRDILNGQGPEPAEPGTQQTTELICGAFMLRSAPLNPLMGALPPAFKVSAGDQSNAATLTGVSALLTVEIDRQSRDSFTAQRLLEVLFAEALRAYQRATLATAPGWFRGLADPKIAQAIQYIHARPSARFDVATLADSVALSPSRFAARFRTVMGESVMEYAGRWRTNIACRMLVETDASLGSIGHMVGYTTDAAFSKAFKARLGVAPARWRAKQKAKQT